MEDLTRFVSVLGFPQKNSTWKKWGIIDGVTLNCGESHILLEKEH